jgi:glucokinase
VTSRRASSEAAGPASPRLVIEEVGVGIGPACAEARTTLRLGPQRFTGTATGDGAHHENWQLAAAAAVGALRHCLQQLVTDAEIPHVELVDAAIVTTRTGQEIVHATIRLVHDNSHKHLLGSALVRNDRCSTAVAAALDATQRALAVFLQPSVLGERPNREPGPSFEGADSLCAYDDAAGAEAPASAETQMPDRPPAAAKSAPATITLGVAIDSSGVRAATVDRAGRLLSGVRRLTGNRAEPDAAIYAASEAAREALAALDGAVGDVGALGVAVPGQLRADDGICVSSKELPGWREIQVAAPLAAELRIPVSLVNSVEATALAEAHFGAARGLRRMVYVRLGEDIEVAVISDGRPLSLGDGSPGHVGHMVIEAGGPRCACGESGCWHALAARDALIGRVVSAIRGGTPSPIAAAVDNQLTAVTPALICRMAAGGDGVARRALEETARYLALGLGNLVALFNPEAVLVDTDSNSGGAALLRAAELYLKSRPRAGLLSRCVLLSPELGESAPVIGAAVSAFAG